MSEKMRGSKLQSCWGHFCEVFRDTATVMSARASLDSKDTDFDVCAPLQDAPLLNCLRIGRLGGDAIRSRGLAASWN